MALRGQEAGKEIRDHGGSLDRARALFPAAPEPWVDLSTGINPHSYPLLDLPATALRRLPEPGAERRLRAVAAEAYGAPSADNVVAAPGTQILLPRIAVLVAQGRALVLGPTYAEHARCAALMGHSVAEITDCEALAEADLAIVVNPNNPDGRLLGRAFLLDLADRMARKGGLLVVDEAFMDVGPQSVSLAPDVRPGLVVLRSFGKFFGLAGVRLGFALAEPETASRLAGEFGPWAVSGPALEYGIAALADHRWATEMRQRLAADAVRLDGLFNQVGVSPAGGTDLYRYIEMPQAASLHNALGRQGILLRAFSWSAAALRCGIPGGEDEWQRLAEALAIWRTLPENRP